MKSAYMPFTYLSASTAHILNALVGPLWLYQPLKTRIPDDLAKLALQERVEIRTPITDDDARLEAALAEFNAWAQANPGRSTAGAGFISTQQGEIPFYEETAISRIRSDLKRYQSTDDIAADSTAGFGARLFLAVAQENDQASDNLDRNLNTFAAQEAAFLDELQDAGEVGFDRRAHIETIWKEDPGARLTTQRIRAWARLASADVSPPDLLMTTSTAVIDTIMDLYGEAIGIEKRTSVRIALPPADAEPVIGGALKHLSRRRHLSPEALSAFASHAADTGAASDVTVSLYTAENRSIKNVIRFLASGDADFQAPEKADDMAGHTLIIVVGDDGKTGEMPG